jgi:hypothetical protein
MRAADGGTVRPSGPEPPDDADRACDCPCHRSGMLQHVVACCRPCPHCRRRIPTGALAAHLARAHPGDGAPP